LRFGNLLDVLIFDDGCLLPRALKGGQFLGAVDSCLLPLSVELMHLTGIDGFTKNAWLQVEQLVLSLLRELAKNRPFRLELIGGLSETTSHVALMQSRVTSLVGSLLLLLPLLSLSRHLGSHMSEPCCNSVFAMLGNQFGFVDCTSRGLVVAAAEVTFLVIFGLFLFNDAELTIYGGSD